MSPFFLILMVGAGLLVANTGRAANTANKSSIKLLNIDSLKVVGMEFEISVTVAIDNPTGNTITIKKPYLRALYNGNEIGNSLPSSELKAIKANARTEISGVNLRVPFSKVPVLVAAVFNSKASDSSITLETSTQLGLIPLKDTEDYKIADLVKILKK